MNERDQGDSRHFVPLVDNEVHLIELSLGDRARWDQQAHTCWGEIVTKSIIHGFIYGRIKLLQEVQVTRIRDGQAASQVAQCGTGAQPRLSGQGVAVIVPFSTHRSHWLQTQDLTIRAQIGRQLQGGERGGVVHLDFETGQRVQQGRSGHGDLVRAVVGPLLQREEWPSERPRCGRQIWGSWGMQRVGVI